MTIGALDSMLARHYGLPPVGDASDEELDFIINYDVKYRMGAELEEDDE
ncbi:MAG: hypothetical protein ACOYY3_15435 [Chloroflexota bacterium]